MLVGVSLPGCPAWRGLRGGRFQMKPRKLLPVDLEAPPAWQDLSVEESEQVTTCCCVHSCGMGNG